MQHTGYVAGDGKWFWLTPRVLRRGRSSLESARLPRIVQPATVYLSVLDGDEVVFIARNGPNRSMNAGHGPGAWVPAHVAASGMLILALRSDDEPARWLAMQHLGKTPASNEALRRYSLFNLI